MNSESATMPTQPPPPAGPTAPHDAVTLCIDRLSGILAHCMADADRNTREPVPALHGTPWKSWDALHHCLIDLARSLLTIGLNADESRDAIARVIGAAVPEASRRAEIESALPRWIDEAVISCIP